VCCPARVISPRDAGGGKAVALTGGLGVREHVALAGLAERARVARSFVKGVLGPGHQGQAREVLAGGAGRQGKRRARRRPSPCTGSARYSRGRPGGANALDKLTALGTVQMVTDKPRGYRPAPALDAAGDPGTSVEATATAA
jgi:hypothetical protein